MNKAELIAEYFYSTGVGSLPHATGSLAEHLLGTYNLLFDWGNTLDVCLAGLFHSIYGTVNYSHCCLPLASRAKVREHIGYEAEELSFLFSRTTLMETCRNFAFEEVDQSPHLVEILEIHSANLTEQWKFLPEELRGVLKNRYRHISFGTLKFCSERARSSMLEIFKL